MEQDPRPHKPKHREPSEKLWARGPGLGMAKIYTLGREGHLRHQSNSWCCCRSWKLFDEVTYHSMRSEKCFTFFLKAGENFKLSQMAWPRGPCCADPATVSGRDTSKTKAQDPQPIPGAQLVRLEMSVSTNGARLEPRSQGPGSVV